MTASKEDSPYPLGSVRHNLMLMRGVWHENLELYNLDGSPLNNDDKLGASSSGSSPFENIAYIDFDGTNLTITNVHIKGRPPISKTFHGKLKENILIFDSLGEGSYKNVGISGGPGVLTFTAMELGTHTQIYTEPDFIILPEPNKRIRHQVLYRHGRLQRTLTAKGARLMPFCEKRLGIDPRGVGGPVHGDGYKSDIWVK